MRKSFVSRLAFLLLTLAASRAAFGQSLTPLLGGRLVRFNNLAQKGTVRFTDSVLATLGDPRCASSPTGASLRLSTDVRSNAEIRLPCDAWAADGTGFRYVDPLGVHGGVERVRLSRHGRLTVRIRGPQSAMAVRGPVAFVDVRLDIGGNTACGRFTALSQNTADLVRASGPSTTCPITCGDGIVDPTEQCDDGNTVSGDCCSPTCTYDYTDPLQNPGCLQDVDHDGMLRIACIGDSNTYSGWPAPDGRPRWCQMLGAEVTSIATIPEGAARSVTFVSSKAPEGYTLAACYDAVFSPIYGWATERVERAKEEKADAVMVALGTNDIGVLHRTPEQIVGCLVDTFVAALPLRMFIATVPPNYALEDQTVIEQTNELIWATFDPENIIDFDTGFDASLFEDPVHLNDAGQLLRAHRAAERVAVVNVPTSTERSIVDDTAATPKALLP